MRGVVTDGGTGNPVAGVRVKAMASWASRKNPAVTGKDGRYEIPGVPKSGSDRSAESRIDFVVDDSLHFNRRVRIEAAAGLEPLNLDVTLARGITVRGRVTDWETGDPVKGTVIYNPLYPNDHVPELWGTSVANPAASTQIQKDGTYEICVLPGPGAIAARIDEWDERLRRRPPRR